MVSRGNVLRNHFDVAKLAKMIVEGERSLDR